MSRASCAPIAGTAKSKFRFLTEEKIVKIIDADSVGYLDIAHADRLTGKEGGFCMACFDGNYPTEVPTKVEKNRFERTISENPKFQK